MESRGAELPVCGVTHSGEVLYGDDLGSIPPGVSVTVVDGIVTHGTEIRRMHL